MKLSRIFAALCFYCLIALVVGCAVVQDVKNKIATDVQSVAGPDLQRGVEIGKQRNLPEGVTCSQGLIDYQNALVVSTTPSGTPLAEPNGLISLAIAGAADANSFNPQTFTLPPLDPQVKKACLLVFAEDKVGLLKLSALLAGVVQGKGVLDGVSALKAAQAAVAVHP